MQPCGTPESASTTTSPFWKPRVLGSCRLPLAGLLVTELVATSIGEPLVGAVPAMTVIRSPRISPPPPTSAPSAWIMTGASRGLSAAFANGLAIAAARGRTATPALLALRMQPKASLQRCAKPDPALRRCRSIT